MRPLLPMYIPVILGTAREGRQSEKVARFALKEIVNFGLKTELIDARDFQTGVTGKEPPNKTELSRKISRADGFLIVTPEYNHGYPGELKIMLDLLYEEYARKPVAFCGVSSGTTGGARAVEQLRLVAIEFHMTPIQEAVYFRNVKNLFDARENLLDPSFGIQLKSLLEELTWYAKVLKGGRKARLGQF